MSDKSIPPNVTLEMVYDAVRDVADGIQESRALWGEAEKNILKLIATERKRLDEAQSAIEELRIEDQDHDTQLAELRKGNVKYGNQIAANRSEIDALKTRISKLEGMLRRDTEMRPPPPSEPPGESDG